MEAGETPTPRPGSRRLSGEEIRRATFPQALRGYDREAVHAMLDRVADWIEGKTGAVVTPGMREEFAKVGERTAGILTAAEEAASKLREEAKEYAERIRAEAEDESRRARLNASQRMDEMIAEAETKAQRIIDDAVARRRQLNQAISSLLERRDEIAADAARLAEELLSAVEELRGPDPSDEADDLEPDSAGEVVADDEPSSEERIVPGAKEPETLEAEPDAGLEQTAVIEPDAEEMEPGEPDSDELPPASEEDEPDSDEVRTQEELRGPSRLLVDPDEEDDFPRRRQ